MKSKIGCMFNTLTNKHLLIVVSVLLFFTTGAFAQNMKVTGVVTSDSDGLPVPGVSVVVKGTTTGTITDMDGKYSISTTKGSVLVFSFIGLKTKEVKVTTLQLNVKLASDLIGLDEVVAIGYGTAKKKELTGAVAQVKSEELEKIVSSDMSSALQGLVAGVNVTSSSGQPGESSSILIRGVSTIYGDNTPLFVVDGVQYEDDPRISPSEIETIDVLKDAASCAIYGVRGAAGVILITTKKGKVGTLKVALNGSYGVQSIQSGTPLMNSIDQTYADFLQARNISGTYDGDMNLNTLLSIYSFTNDSKLEDIVINDLAPTQNYNVNISGGAKDINYNVTMGYYNQDGIILDSGFEKFNTRINTNYKKGRWDISANLSFSKEKVLRAPNSALSYMVRYHPTYPLIDPDNIKPIYAEHDGALQSTNWIMNSFLNEDESKNLSYNANFRAKFSLLKGLSIASRVSIGGRTLYRRRFDPFDEVYRSTGELAKKAEENSSVRMDARYVSSFNWENTLIYNTKIRDDHKLTFMVTHSVLENTNEDFYADRAAVSNNKIKSIAGTTSNPEIGTSMNDYTNRLLGLVGRVQYNYKSRYLFSASARYDGSSKFAQDGQWKMFPSYSGAWNVSEESFWQPLKNTISNFKLRASLGTVGNERIPPYRFSSLVVQNIDYAFGKEDVISNGAAQTSYANADVQWETSVQSNVGVDLALFRNKVTFSAEYYVTNKKDMLMPYPVPPSSGSLPYTNLSSSKSSNVTLNIGDMTNQGVEVALGYKFRTGLVNWSANGTFSTNENKVDKISDIEGVFLFDDGVVIYEKRANSRVTGLKEGYEAGAFFVYETNGIIKTFEQLTEYQKLVPSAKMGDLMYVDSKADGVLNEADRVYAGSGMPKYEAGFSLRADFKGFDFSMRWYSALGHKLYNGAKASAYIYNRHQDLVYQYTDVNTFSNIPSYRGKDHPNYQAETDYYIEKGDYLRLKELTLGYTIPKVLTNKAGIRKMRLYLSAQNPLTFTDYTGYDPEIGGGISTRGLDRGNYPVSALYTVGFNLNF